MLKRLLLALGALTVLLGSFDAAYAARPIAAIQADIATTTAQLSVAQAAAAQAAAVIPPINAKLAAYQAELAAAMVMISADGTTATPGLGQITDQNGTFWVVKADGKIYRTPTGAGQAVVSSSQDVIQLVMVYADGPGLRQQNKKLAWWTQPLDGSAGTLTTAPGTVTPPIPPTPGTSPVGGYKTLVFSDDFKGGIDKNWTRTFPTKSATDPYAYGYDGKTTQPWFVINPTANGYPAAKGMPDPIEVLAGGGVKLKAYADPRMSGSAFRTPQGQVATHAASWLWSKITAHPNCYIEFDITIPNTPGAVGGYWAQWLIETSKWQEIDITDGGLQIEPARWFYGAGVPGGYQGFGTARWQDIVTPGRHKFGVNWTDNKIEWAYDGKVVDSVVTNGQMPLPMYFGDNQVVGGWDGNYAPGKMTANSEHTLNAVNMWCAP